jgi:integrase
VQGEGLVVSEPKTELSRFPPPDHLGALVIEALKIHLARRAEMAKRANWKEAGLFFTTEIGTPVAPRNLIRHFKTKLKEAGLPEIRFHDLRQTAAAILLSKNVHLKIIQELCDRSKFGK